MGGFLAWWTRTIGRRNDDGTGTRESPDRAPVSAPSRRTAPDAQPARPVRAQAAPGREPGPLPQAAVGNAFALALYARLRGTGANLICSPFSIRVVLAMVLAGARGETAAQMKRALGFGDDEEALHGDMGAALRWLESLRANGCDFDVANSLWIQRGAPILDGFRDRMERHYGGESRSVDYRTDAEAVRVRVNSWVEENTRGMIRELLSPRSLTRDTRLVLANAIAFRGAWAFPFPADFTHDAVFRLATGARRTASFMSQEEVLPYLKGPSYQAVDLPYQGERLSLLVILPDADDGLEALEERLDADWLRECSRQLVRRQVEVELPKFRLEWGGHLRDELAALGVNDVFDRSRADLSGINGLRPPSEEALFVSQVVHRAVIEVDESGTTAAAASANVITTVSALPLPPPPPVFRADHPFLFAIRERASGAILFLGRVVDPEGSPAP